MNPMTNVKNIQKLNDRVLQLGVEDDSWHKQYKDSAYIFIGGLPFDLTEGDILCVFSQYGEIIDINLVRDKATGKSKGYGFLCYENQKSTILAVDNFNGIKLGGRTIRVDHAANYKRPKGDEKDEQGERKELPLVSCAPKTPPSSEGEDVEKETRKKKKKDKSRKRSRNRDGKKMEGNRRDVVVERERKIQKMLTEEDQSVNNRVGDEQWTKEAKRSMDMKIRNEKTERHEGERRREDYKEQGKYNEIGRGRDNVKDEVRNFGRKGKECKEMHDVRSRDRTEKKR